MDDEGEPFVLPIGEELDLHAFAPRDVASVVEPRDVASVVEEYLRECRARGVLVVRVVHGRGRGVQRAEVRRLLAGLPGIGSFADAPPSWGGWGATIVRLEPQLDS